MSALLFCPLFLVLNSSFCQRTHSKGGESVQGHLAAGFSAAPTHCGAAGASLQGEGSKGQANLSLAGRQCKPNPQALCSRSEGSQPAAELSRLERFETQQRHMQGPAPGQERPQAGVTCRSSSVHKDGLRWAVLASRGSWGENSSGTAAAGAAGRGPVLQPCCSLPCLGSSAQLLFRRVLGPAGAAGLGRAWSSSVPSKGRESWGC